MENNSMTSSSEFDAAAFTKSLLEQYYHLDVEPFLNALADNAMWIGPGNVYVFGAAAIRKLFDTIYMPVIHLSEVEMAEIYRTENLAVVVGQFNAVTDEQADGILAVHQRITFQYLLTDGEWKILHLHVSNEYSELVGDEVYPIKMSRETYRYLQQLLAKKFMDSKKLTLEEAAETYFINPDEIVCVEAMKNRSIIHCMTKTIVSSKPIGTLEQKLPANFYRAHRGFLVNCNSIVKISRFMLELQGGLTIPLPEKRYTAIREEIKTLLSRAESVPDVGQE